MYESKQIIEPLEHRIKPSLMYLQHKFESNLRSLECVSKESLWYLESKFKTTL